MAALMCLLGSSTHASLLLASFECHVAGGEAELILGEGLEALSLEASTAENALAVLSEGEFRFIDE